RARPEGGTAHVVHHVVEETVQHREGSPCACHGCTSFWSCLRSPARLARASPPPVCLHEPINSVRTLSRARTSLTPLTMAREEPSPRSLTAAQTQLHPRRTRAPAPPDSRPAGPRSGRVPPKPTRTPRFSVGASGFEPPTPRPPV